MLEKIKEFYDSGYLVGELFEKDYFVVLLSRECVALKNMLGAMSADPKIKNYIILEEKDFASVSNAIEKWREVKDTLWGIVHSGSSTFGYCGTYYYPPNSETGTYIKKGKSHEHLKIGKTEEILKIGSLEFVIERFELIAKREDQMAYLSIGRHKPLIVEAFDSYIARKDNYRDCDPGLIKEMIESQYR